MSTPVPATTAFTYPASAAHLTWQDASGNANSLWFDLVESEEWGEDATVTEHPVEVGADVTDHVRVQLRTCTLTVRATNEPITANNWDQAEVTSSTIDLPGQTWDAGSGQIIIPEWDNPIRTRALVGTLTGLAGGLIGNAVGGSHTGSIAGDIAALVGLEAAFLLDPATVEPVTVQTDAGLEPNTASSVTVQTQQWPGGQSGTDYVLNMTQAVKLLKDTAQLLDVVGSKQFCSPMVVEKYTTSRSYDTGTGSSLTIGLKEVRIVSTQTVPVPTPALSAGGGVPPQNKGAQDPAPATTPQSQSLMKNFSSFYSSLPPGTSLATAATSFLGL